MLEPGSFEPIAAGTMVEARSRECLEKSGHSRVWAERFASRSRTGCWCMSGCWSWARTWSYVWTESRSQSRVESRGMRESSVVTSVVEAWARSSWFVVKPGTVQTMGASSQVCLVGDGLRFPRLVHRTSFCSGRPTKRRAWSRWWSFSSPCSLGCCGGSLSFQREMIGMLIGCLSCERYAGEALRFACGRTWWASGGVVKS